LETRMSPRGREADPALAFIKLNANGSADRLPVASFGALMDPCLTYEALALPRERYAARAGYRSCSLASRFRWVSVGACC